MSTTSTTLRRRIGLVAGAGALVLLGGVGVAFAASTADNPGTTGWSTVVDADRAPSGTGTGSATGTGSGSWDCPEEGAAGSSTEGSIGAQPDAEGSNQDGEL